MRNFTYGFGLNTILSEEEARKNCSGKEPQRFASAAECAKQAVAEGYSFIMGYAQNGDKRILAWNIRVVSKEEALRHYMCDGDKRTILNRSKAKVWIIAPVKGYSDMLIPFEGRIRSLKVVKLEDLV